MPKSQIVGLVVIVTLTISTPTASRGDVGAPLPGYWELQNTWVFVLRFRTAERKCFTAADVGNVLQGPSNAHYACTYPMRQVGEGRLTLNGSCVETHGQIAKIEAERTYGPPTST